MMFVDKLKRFVSYGNLMPVLPRNRILRSKVVLAMAWIASLLLVYYCCRVVTHKVHADIERSLIQPKESPPLLAYLLLLQFYMPMSKSVTTTAPVIHQSRTHFEMRDIEAKLKTYKCKMYNFHEDIPKVKPANKLNDQQICVHARSKNLLTLFTTMYDRKDKMFIFNNTVNLWPQLKDVKPVLFLTPDNTSSPAMVRLVTLACNSGWDVLVAPHCNNDSYPVLRSMWQIVLSNYDSFFFGYTNGDMIFDDTLTLTLEHLKTHDSHIFKHKHLLSGQRHNIYVSHHFAFVFCSTNY